jgi:predicted ArsR family transcriptional regulator
VTQWQTIINALRDGPGTSVEIAAETGLSTKHCCAWLRWLWQRGYVTRTDSMIRTTENGCGRGAFIYTLKADA